MIYSESNPVPLKYALNLLGAKVGKPRPPLTELSNANAATLRQTMQRLGILSEDSYQMKFFNKKLDSLAERLHNAYNSLSSEPRSTKRQYCFGGLILRRIINGSLENPSLNFSS